MNISIENQNKAGVYRIRNTENQRCYFGSTKSFITRAKQHFMELKEGRHQNKYLQEDVDKFGINAFVFDILEIHEINLERLAAEQRYITKHFDGQKLCYNIRKTVSLTELEGKTKYTKESLLERTIKDEESQCMIWQASFHHGYPCVKSTKLVVSRLLLQPNKNQIIKHTKECKHGISCVNPDHMYITDRKATKKEKRLNNDLDTK